MRFHSVVRLNGKTATGIPVPPEVVESLGQGKKPPVRVTIGNYTYRTSIGSVDGEYMLSLSAENRQAAGLSAGDAVDVDLELDNSPREVTLPDDFAAALEQDAAARKFFESLSYSKKQVHLQSIEQAKTPETRQRRLEKALAALREGKA